MSDADDISRDLDGVDRAAVLLMTLGEDDAAEILKHMGPKEVQKISGAMAAVANVSKDQVTGVLTDLCVEIEGHTSLGIGSEEYIKKMLINALGEDKAGSIIDRVLSGADASGLEQLKWLDPRSIADIIRLEHPQIIAVVLSYLESDLAAEVMINLPANMRTDLIMRVATLDSIHPSALQQLNDIMEKQFSGNANLKSASVGGVKTAANLMNFLDSSIEAVMSEEIKDIDNEIAEKIQDLMFVFDDLSEVDDKGIQTLLREISTDSLVLALKGADDSIKEKILKNMSKRAGEMLREDLETQGPVKLSDVEGAQKEILSIARRLADSGEIMLGGKGAEEYV